MYRFKAYGDEVSHFAQQHVQEENEDMKKTLLLPMFALF